MGNLLFFRRSCAYRHAARVTLREARALPRGMERNLLLQRAVGLRELARVEAWLEGQTPRMLGDTPMAPAGPMRQVTAACAIAVPGR